MNGVLFVVSDLFDNNIVLFQINILIVVFVYYLRSFWKLQIECNTNSWLTA